jgi:hypothetical protein
MHFRASSPPCQNDAVKDGIAWVVGSAATDERGK